MDVIEKNAVSSKQSSRPGLSIKSSETSSILSRIRWKRKECSLKHAVQECSLLGLSNANVYAPEIQAHLGTTAHFCGMVDWQEMTVLEISLVQKQSQMKVFAGFGIVVGGSRNQGFGFTVQDLELGV